MNCQSEGGCPEALGRGRALIMAGNECLISESRTAQEQGQLMCQCLLARGCRIAARERSKGAAAPSHAQPPHGLAGSSGRASQRAKPGIRSSSSAAAAATATTSRASSSTGRASGASSSGSGSGSSSNPAIQTAVQHKEAGNALFKQQRFVAAASRYAQGVVAMAQGAGGGALPQGEQRQLLVDLPNNSGLALIRQAEQDPSGAAAYDKAQGQGLGFSAGAARGAAKRICRWEGFLFRPSHTMCPTCPINFRLQLRETAWPTLRTPAAVPLSWTPATARRGTSRASWRRHSRTWPASQVSTQVSRGVCRMGSMVDCITLLLLLAQLGSLMCGTGSCAGACLWPCSLCRGLRFAMCC